MKERPILFCGEMVRAILDGRKTQTRRVVKESAMIEAQGKMMEGEESDWNPYGQPGDKLYVKETFALLGNYHHADSLQPTVPIYRASWPTIEHNGAVRKWKPSIFMPRWASRITLEIESVRVERVQEITEDDAKAEGCYPVTHGDGSVECGTRKTVYHQLWDTINGKTHPWSSNPWVWVITFHRVKP